MGTQKVRRLRFTEDRDTDHEVEKIDRQIDRLTAQIERFGFGSYEAQRAQSEIRNLKNRRARLTR